MTLDQFIAEVKALAGENYPDETTYRVTLACFGVTGLRRLTEEMSKP